MIIDYFILTFSALSFGVALGMLFGVKKIIDLERRIISLEENIQKMIEKTK